MSATHSSKFCLRDLRNSAQIYERWTGLGYLFNTCKEMHKAIGSWEDIPEVGFPGIQRQCHHRQLAQDILDGGVGRKCSHLAPQLVKNSCIHWHSPRKSWSWAQFLLIVVLSVPSQHLSVMNLPPLPLDLMGNFHPCVSSRRIFSCIVCAEGRA